MFGSFCSIYKIYWVFLSCFCLIFSYFNTSPASRTSGYVFKITSNIQNNAHPCALKSPFDLLIESSRSPADPLRALFRAEVEIVSGHSRIFSGDDVRLRCSIPDTHQSTWSYLWFKGSEELQQRGQELLIWRAKISDGGKFYCQGVRNTVMGQIHTVQSLPVEIFVDGKIDILINIHYALNLHLGSLE